MINIPPGITELREPLLVQSGEVLRGCGPSSILRLAPGVKLAPNEAVVMTRGFPAAVESNRWVYRAGQVKSGTSAYGEDDGLHAQFTIEGLTIDGNARNGAEAGGLYVYGLNYRVTNVNILDTAGHGFWTECGDRPEAGSSVAGDAEFRSANMHEAHVDQLRISEPRGHGILWRGPNDSYLGNVQIKLPGRSGLVVESRQGVYQAGGLKLGWIHAYPGSREPLVHLKAWKIFGGPIYADTPQGEGLKLEGSDCLLSQVIVIKHNGWRRNSSFGVSIGGNGNRIDSLFYEQWQEKDHVGTEHGGGLEITGASNIVASGELRGSKVSVPGQAKCVTGKGSTFGGRVTEWR